MNTGGPASEKTLRDEFAGQALAGLCANPGGPIQANGMTGWGFANCNADYIAGTAYDLASAMLSEKARREATGKDSLQVPDHSPDAGKMAELEAANRELVEALEGCLENLERWCPVKHREARDILSKHKESK